MKYRIHALWSDYRNKVPPFAAPPIQLQETRRAFYAGCEATLNKLGKEMSPGDSLDPRKESR